MPIDVRIDRKKRIVFATPRGALTHEDMVAYQKSVWSRRDVRGYGEVIDMSDVATLEFKSPKKVRELAELSASMDRNRAGSRTAIVASSKVHAALAKMYRLYRDQSERSEVGLAIFSGRADALRWAKPRKIAPRRKTGAPKESAVR